MKKIWSVTLAAALIGCGSGHEAAPSAPAVDADASVPGATCVDRDGDGFGPGCALGPDCNDDAKAITDDCYRCATPDEGCPCSKEGDTVACGKIESRTESGVTCKMAERVCRGGTWTTCGDSSLLGEKTLTVKGLGSTPTGCSANPCDPYCKTYPDAPDPSLTDGDAGVVGSEAGLTPKPIPVDPGPPVTCADTTAEAKPIPLDLVVMLDKSGSMAGDRWNSVTTALQTFAGAPSSAGTGMAINYFGIVKDVTATCCAWFICWSCTAAAESCSDADYGDYATYGVPMGTLPGSMTGHAVTIRDSMNAQSPTTSTPTRPAMNGAVAYARSWQLAHPTHRTAIVLATDGEPNTCSSDVTNVSASAAAGYSGTPSVPTYVIGVGPSVASLDAIAKAGSGGTESYIPVPSGDTTAFVAAMNKIRVKAVGCDYTLPSPPSGDIDPAATDVKVTNASSGSTSTLSRKADAASCAGGDGFYYDDPSKPTKVTLCPSTCTTVGSDLAYKVQLTFKCDASCGSGAFKATPTPVGMYVMLDKSGSMAGTRWSNITNALKTFINDPSSDGLAVGLRYFPMTSPSADYCDAGNYSTASVAIDTLPGNRTALVSSIDGTAPGGNTPTLPALQGAISYTRSWATTHASYKPIVVLATDGEPTMCGANNNVTYIADNVAKAAGVDGTPSIATYVIGVGSSVGASGMDTIASKGGTGSAYMVNDGSPTAFLNAMNDIRKKTLSCEFGVPSSMLGVMDPATAQVRYVNDAGTTVKVSRVTSAAACPVSGDGWYFDDNTKPTKVLLCTNTCSAIKGLSSAALYVFYDCLAGGDGTFTRDYRIDCPSGTSPVWGAWSWDASTPGDSRIDFVVTSGNTVAELNANPVKPLVFTKDPGPASLVGTPIGVTSSPVNTQLGYAYVDTSLALGGLPRHTAFVRVRARLLVGPTTGATPVLKKWNQEVSCVPSE